MNEFQTRLTSDPAKRRKSSSESRKSNSSRVLQQLNDRLEKEYERRSERSKRSSSPDSEAPWPEQSYIVDRRVYLELMVVVDKEMEEYYGANLENHVLTIMFMVNEMTSGQFD